MIREPEGGPKTWKSSSYVATPPAIRTRIASRPKGECWPRTSAEPRPAPTTGCSSRRPSGPRRPPRGSCAVRCNSSRTTRSCPAWRARMRAGAVRRAWPPACERLLDQLPAGGVGLAISHTPLVERAAFGLTGSEVEPFAECEGIARAARRRRRHRRDGDPARSTGTGPVGPARERLERPRRAGLRARRGPRRRSRAGPAAHPQRDRPPRHRPRLPGHARGQRHPVRRARHAGAGVLDPRALSHDWCERSGSSAASSSCSWPSASCERSERESSSTEAVPSAPARLGPTARGIALVVVNPGAWIFFATTAAAVMAEASAGGRARGRAAGRHGDDPGRLAHRLRLGPRRHREPGAAGRACPRVGADRPRDRSCWRSGSRSSCRARWAEPDRRSVAVQQRVQPDREPRPLRCRTRSRASRRA